MATFEMNCSVRGYHVYQPLWTATIGDNLTCRQEPTKDMQWQLLKTTVLLDTFLVKFLVSVHFFFGEEGVLLV